MFTVQKMPSDCVGPSPHFQAGESNDSNDWDNSKADTHEVLPPGACEAVDNGYLRLRSDGTYDAFVCVPFDAVCGDGDEDGETPALAALLRDDRRVFIGNFRNRKLGYVSPIFDSSNHTAR